MKWRTLFVSAAVLGLFMFGSSSLEKKKDCSREYSARIGRSILQDGDRDPSGDTVNDDPEKSKPWDDKQPVPAGDVNCSSSDEVFKRQLKKFLKHKDEPESWVVTCASDTTQFKSNCQSQENWTGDLYVDSNKCRVPTYTCSGKLNDGTELDFEPPEPDNQNFPKDAFTPYARSHGAFIFHVIGVLYMFFALALVCDHYFVPTLDVIIEKYDISPDVAGATLMAAGGSAPELFTSIIGVFIAVSDVGIGTIVGSAVFNVLFVIAACAFASAKALDLTAWPLIRDTSFYSTALLLLVWFFQDDSIVWWEALILFVLYFCYVGFMKINGVVEKKFLEFFPSLKGKQEEDEKDQMNAGFKFNSKRRPLLALMRGKVENVSDNQEAKPGVGMEGLKITLQGDEADNLKGEEEDEDADEVKETEEEKGKREGEAESDEEDSGYRDYIRGGPPTEHWTAEKVMWVISLPLMFPMWLTVPDPTDPGRKRLYVVSFVNSILWIAGFSYLMVWWATLVGEALGISDAVMGLTFLAAGTSVPDLITSVLVAKEGKGDMAVSSSIGSNLFDVTVGLPVPWLIYCAVNQKAVDVNSVGMGCNIGMLFLMLLVVFLSILAFKWKMTKAMGGIMLVLYLIFVIVSLGLSECWFACPSI